MVPWPCGYGVELKFEMSRVQARNVSGSIPHEALGDENC